MSGKFSSGVLLHRLRQKFRQKSSLMVHKQIHTGVKFACDMCPKLFSRKDSLRLHKRTQTQHHLFLFQLDLKAVTKAFIHNLPLICLKFALVKNQKVCVSKWRDKRDVLYMSTIHSAQMSQNKEESTEVSKKHILIETLEMNNDNRKEKKRCSSC